MRTKPILILAAALLCAACEQAETSASGSQSSAMRLDATFEEKTYELGETIPITLQVEQTHATAETFNLTVTASGNLALTLEGSAVELGTAADFNFSVNNADRSTRTLTFEATPLASAALDRTLGLEFSATSADGKTSTVKRIDIPATNSSPITASVAYSGDAITSMQTLDIALTVTKEGYTGNLTASVHHTAGEGICTLNTLSIAEDAPFVIKAEQSPLTLSYAPSTLGVHTFTITVTDGRQSAEATVTTEVYHPDGLTRPDKDGAYIYAKNYDGSPFFTAAEWTASDKSAEVEGIAFFLGNIHILMPLHASQPMVFGNREDDLTTIPAIGTTSPFDGKADTECIHNALREGLISSAPIIEACYNFDPSHPGRWYLPSVTQLSKLSLSTYHGWIAACMKAAGGTLFTEQTKYVTSSVKQKSYQHAYTFHPFRLSNGEYASLSWLFVEDEIAYFPIRDL